MGKVYLKSVLFAFIALGSLTQMFPGFIETFVIAADKNYYANTGQAITDSTENLSQMNANNTLAGFSTGDPQIDNYIVTSSLRYNVDPLLIYAQMRQESNFKTQAISHKGASGLMQLMPDTAKRFGVRDIYNPQQNIDAGVKYMRWLLNKFNGDVNLALAGYNAGEGAVMKYGYQIPPYRETQTYVARITRHYSQIKNRNFSE